MAMLETNEKIVLVTHCVDTEGPLFESIDATFGRLKTLFGIDGITPTYENLEKLKRAEIDLGGVQDEVAQTLVVI